METKQGLYNKYIIQKADGTPVDPDAQYFVLRLDTDPAARVALICYAEYIEDTNVEFAKQLRNLVFSIEPGKRSG